MRDTRIDAHRMHTFHTHTRITHARSRTTHCALLLFVHIVVLRTTHYARTHELRPHCARTRPHTQIQTRTQTQTQAQSGTDTIRHRHTDTQTRRHADTQTHRHTDRHTHTHSYEPVKRVDTIFVAVVFYLDVICFEAMT